MQIKYINCEYCGASIEGKTSSCPKCGGENKLSPLFIADEKDEQNTPAFSPEEIRLDEMRRKGISTEDRKKAEAIAEKDRKKLIRFLCLAGVIVLIIAVLESILL